MSQLPMMIFMFWMTGSSLSIFTIMFTVSFASKPFASIANTNTMYEPFEKTGISLLLPKLAYIAANLVTVAVAAYKFGNMGIIPVQPADWAGLLSPKFPMESNFVILN